MPKTITFRKFIPCQDTWFIRIPYSLEENTSSTAEDLDVPTLVIKGDLGGINKDNPQEVSQGEVLSLSTNIPISGQNVVLAFEYNSDDIKKIELHRNGEIISRGVLPADEGINNVNNREVAFGPITNTGSYEILVFTNPTNETIEPIQVKLFNGDTLIRAGDVFFSQKSSILTDDKAKTGLIILTLIIIIAIILGKNKK